MKRIVAMPLFVAVVAFTGAPAFAQQPQELAGVVVGVEGHMLHMSSATGQAIEVKLADDTHVSLFTPKSLADIESGTFVGATAKPDANGRLVASEVHIFPEALRGTGEGHYPMKSKPGNTMTNATVSKITDESSGSAGSMTNATVAKVGPRANGRVLRLVYKGGQQDIFVPGSTPVVLYERGTLASLVPGSHVIVRATTSPDGTLVASRISVGKNGSVPPL